MSERLERYHKDAAREAFERALWADYKRDFDYWLKQGEEELKLAKLYGKNKKAKAVS